MVQKQAEHTNATQRRWQELRGEDCHLRRCRRLDAQLGVVTARYMAARGHSQRLVDDMKHTLADANVQTADGYRWEYFRETTEKWISCLSGQSAFRNEFVDEQQQQLQNLISDESSSLVNIVDEEQYQLKRSTRFASACGGDGDGHRHRNLRCKATTTSDRSHHHHRRRTLLCAKKVRRPLANPQASNKIPDDDDDNGSNIIMRNIRKIRSTKMRSCMKLLPLTAEEHQQIDDILKEGMLSTKLPSIGSETERGTVQNPYTLNGEERSRLKTLNDVLALENTSDGKHLIEQPSKSTRVRFANAINEEVAPKPLRSTIKKSDQKRITWIDAQLDRLSSAEKTTNYGLTSAHLEAAETEEEFKDFKARRIVNYALGTE